jgi:hypothetical protein
MVVVWRVGMSVMGGDQAITADAMIVMMRRRGATKDRVICVCGALCR